MIILGIETSCDETSVSVLKIENESFSVLSNVVSSQIELHSRWGGVVPNLAAREHLKNIIPVAKNSLDLANIAPENVDLISVTRGPGLIPALLIGTTTAKTLSYLWKKPLIGIHHIEGHIYANFLSGKLGGIFHPRFPILCLVVSGGHTQLVLMKSHLEYEIIGQTLDDAAGEAFDKVARILGLGYPGGPAIAAAAARPAGEDPSVTDNFQINSNEKISKSKIQNIKLPRPMINSNDFNFSFSGLKTAVLYLTKKNEKGLRNEIFISRMCQEFQQAVIDVLVRKTVSAAKKFGIKTVMLAGGVSANQELRRQLESALKNELPEAAYNVPDAAYSLDNAAMIAAAGFFRWNKKKSDRKFLRELENNWKNLETDANLKLV